MPRVWGCSLSASQWPTGRAKGGATAVGLQEADKAVVKAHRGAVKAVQAKQARVNKARADRVRADRDREVMVGRAA